MLVYIGVCFRVNQRRQELVSIRRIADARACWAQWINLFYNSGCVSILIRFLQAFKQLENAAKAHPVLGVGLSALLIVVGPDEKLRRRILSTAQTHHRVDLIDLLLHVVDHAQEVLCSVIAFLCTCPYIVTRC